MPSTHASPRCWPRIKPHSIVGGDAGLDDALVEALKLEVLSSQPDLLRQGVMLLTLDRADADGLRFGAYSFLPGLPGELIGEGNVLHTMYDALASRTDAVRDRYPALFEGVYVNVQRYRFEPMPATGIRLGMTA